MFRTSDLPVPCLSAPCAHDVSNAGHGIPLSWPSTVARRFGRWFQNRMAVRKLREMDAHQLDDIGLCPADIHQANSGPILSDPMAMLAAARKDPLRGRRHS